MTAPAAHVSKERGVLITPKVLGGLVVAGAIAWMAPFDHAFSAITFGIPALRAGLIVALAVAGLAIGRHIGLGVEPRDLKRPIFTPVAVALATAVGCAIADWLLRSGANPSYIQFMSSTPLTNRLLYFIVRAFNEEILYRLFLGSALIWMLGRIWKMDDGRPAAGAFYAGFLLSQWINIWINVISGAPITPASLLHDVVRFVLPGLVWSWLYWRHGFQSNEIAHTTAHLFFQPLASLRL